MPYIELKSKKDSLLGKSKAVEVSGIKLDSGEEWSKKFFKNKSDLVDALEGFSVGDEVNVVMEQDENNKKFWNIVDFVDLTEEDREKIDKAKKFYKSDDSKADAPKGGGGGSWGARRADGGSRGDDTNRSAAIYLAREIVNMCGISEAVPSEVATEMIKIADQFIFPYIKDGKIPEPAVKQESAKPRRAAPPATPSV